MSVMMGMIRCHPLLQHLFNVRQLLFRETEQPVLHRLQVYDDEDAGIVEHGRYDRRHADFVIGPAQVLGHDERGCPHDRRHEDPSR